MSEYHLIGEPIDQNNCPAFFELRLPDFLPCVSPKSFGLPADTPTIDPYAYFITSGDALAKAIRLKKDIQELIPQLHQKYAKTRTTNGEKKWIYNKGYKKYIKTIIACADCCGEMVNGLCKAKGINCFLETEWREQHLIVIPKNPRNKAKNDPQ